MKELQKYIQSIVDTVVFVDDKATVDKYKCLSCGKIAVKHYVTNCQHIFCFTCTKALMHHKCPVCGHEEITKVVTDEEFEKKVQDLKVKCPYKDRGCLQEISLRDYQDHETCCRFSTKNLLPKVCQDKGAKERQEKVEDGGFQVKKLINLFDEKSKNQNVPQYPFNRLMLGTSKIMETEKNEEEKPKTTVQDIAEIHHMESEKIETVTEFEHGDVADISKPTPKCAPTQSPLVTIEGRSTGAKPKTCPMGQTVFDSDELDGQCITDIWRIDGFHQKWQSLKRPPTGLFKSRNFVHQEFDLNYAVNLEVSKTHVQIAMAWKRWDKAFIHARKFTLIDQSDGSSKRHISFIDTPYFSKDVASLINKDHFYDKNLVQISLLQREYDTYVRDGCIIIKISLIPQALMYKSVTYNNGLLLWCIDNYALKKQEAMTGAKPWLISDSFYTAPTGYRMHAWLHPNGSEASRGKYISVYITFLAGGFDHMLPKKFNGVAIFCLMDQSSSPDKQHLFREVVFSIDKTCTFHGPHDFVLHSQAENARYLKKDTLVLGINVQCVKI